MNEEKPNIEVVKNLIKQKAVQHRQHIKRCQEAERYYRNENDILRTGVRGRDNEPLRNADNRIPDVYKRQGRCNEDLSFR